MTPFNSDINFLLEQNSNAPTRQPEKLISKYIHGRRIMPESSPFPGVYDIFKTPYIVEICDNMSPYSPVQGQAVKKGVQIAITTSAENLIAYGIDERPCDMMYLTGTEDLIKDFSNGRLDPLLQSCGLQEKLITHSENIKSRKGGDTIDRKYFPGGSLILGSIQSSAHARSKSVKIMILDEIDLVNVQMSSGEGNRLKVFFGRLIAFGERGKTFALSTPREYGNSLIDIQYNRGDKRKFFVKCPHCKKEQWLCQGTENGNYGLKGDYKAGILQQGYYLCYHCHDAIFDHHKEYLLKSGVWRPTVTAKQKNYRSYHIPSFYSPPAMMSFTTLREEWDEAQEQGDDGMRSYTNLYLGKSFKPSGERPKFESVIEIRSGYESGVVPSNILFLTMAVDVQQGKDKYKDMTNKEIDGLVNRYETTKDDKKLGGVPRLEVEIVGHGPIYRTASIKYLKFYGRIDDNQSGAWEKLTNYMQETGLKFKRKDGYEFNTKVIFIDSGYGMYSDLVCNYCESLPYTYAIKGSRPLKQDKLKLAKIDEVENGNIKKYKISKSGAGIDLILINTNYYKGFIYRNLRNTPDPVNGQPGNSHMTPQDYPDHYFRGLTAEEHKKDGSFHNLAGRPNEPLDLLVYNKAAADFYIDGIIEADQQVYRKKGVTNKEKLRELVNRRTITEKYIEVLKKKGW